MDVVRCCPCRVGGRTWLSQQECRLEPPPPTARVPSFAPQRVCGASPGFGHSGHHPADTTRSPLSPTSYNFELGRNGSRIDRTDYGGYASSGPQDKRHFFCAAA